MSKEINIDPLALNSLGRCLADIIPKFFEDPENDRKFQEWKKQREIEIGKKKDKVDKNI